MLETLTKLAFDQGAQQALADFGLAPPGVKEADVLSAGRRGWEAIRRFSTGAGNLVRGAEGKATTALAAQGRQEAGVAALRARNAAAEAKNVAAAQAATQKAQGARMTADAAKMSPEAFAAANARFNGVKAPRAPRAPRGGAAPAPAAAAPAPAAAAPAPVTSRRPTRAAPAPAAAATAPAAAAPAATGQLPAKQKGRFKVTRQQPPPGPTGQPPTLGGLGSQAMSYAKANTPVALGIVGGAGYVAGGRTSSGPPVINRYG